MSHPLYLASVPMLRQMLGALAGVLAKAEAHAAARKIDPDALLQARLYPDMFPLARQVQLASDFAKGIVARLAGMAPPSWDDGERGFAELQGRIERTLAFIDGVAQSAFEDSEAREVVVMAGTPRERRFDGGADYLQRFGMPNFFFHVTTAYAILRHNGVELGKADFLGAR